MGLKHLGLPEEAIACIETEDQLEEALGQEFSYESDTSEQQHEDDDEVDVLDILENVDAFQPQSSITTTSAIVLINI